MFLKYPPVLWGELFACSRRWAKTLRVTHVGWDGSVCNLFPTYCCNVHTAVIHNSSVARHFGSLIPASGMLYCKRLFQGQSASGKPNFVKRTIVRRIPKLLLARFSKERFRMSFLLGSANWKTRMDTLILLTMYNQNRLVMTELIVKHVRNSFRWRQINKVEKTRMIKGKVLFRSVAKCFYIVSCYI